MDNIILSLLSVTGGLVLGIFLMFIYNKLVTSKAKQTAHDLIEDAKLKADSLMKEKLLDAKSQTFEMKAEVEREIKELRRNLDEYENKISLREQNIDRRDMALQNKENLLQEKTQVIEDKINDIDKKRNELNEKIRLQDVELERISNLTSNEAKEELFKRVEIKTEREMTAYIKEREEVANEQATAMSRNILAMAIQRYANEAAAEKTVSVVSIPSEEMKGRIIGREGRNIRAIEQITGVDLIIDDTPETITVSCFNPIRREIAKKSLELLIKDGRIHPARIEEVVNKVTAELDEIIKEAGEETIFKLGLSRMDKELVMMLGRLKYRTSYGQNALQHSIEVANLSASMAAEVGLNQMLAKRAGLLHDIGKAIDFELEGGHVELGSKMARRHGEHSVVINAIESHHGDVEVDNPISCLVIAADTLSAARPGARSEALENYIQRLEKLEGISNSFNGVEKTYAIQAGREIRVIVTPEKIDDLACYKLARDIKNRIENELSYPGQIKVTVIRETRASDVAR